MPFTWILLLPLSLFGYVIYKNLFKKKDSEIPNVYIKPIEWKKAKTILTNSFNYFNQLSPSHQKEFIYRCLRFKKQIKWISPDHTTITTEMKTLISASAIQLTFGIPKVNFGPFKTIAIFKDAYYNKMTNAYHKGEVNNNGLIVLSWKYFQEGYAYPNDKLNLGLHELAHALDLALFLSQGRKYYLRRLMEHFQNKAFQEYIRLKHKQPSFLREYGGTNMREFFSVAVEHFFEAPEEFRIALPELYNELCLLLNQDPANKINRGYKMDPAQRPSNQYSQQKVESSISKIKTNITFSIISSLFNPLALIFLFVPVILFSIKTYPLSLPVFISALSLILATQVYTKAIWALITPHHLIFHKLKYLDIQSIHLKNILFININQMLTHQELEVIYYDKEILKEISTPLYCSAQSMFSLKKELMHKGVLLKLNNKWVKSI
ncbi:hypothetical protein DMA11_08030 [Marinilabiliaceae bacterium JC017]|nr:hypothetical protein DMA11_08030 [Marinilabiliaceae bacterium JC017]